MKVYCGSADAQPCTPFPQIISYEYILAELTQQSKTLNEHLSHLIIHGILHLLDFDHEDFYQHLVLNEA